MKDLDKIIAENRNPDSGKRLKPKPISIDEMVYRVRNPGTSQDLILPVVFISPVTDWWMKENVRKNSARDLEWIDEKSVHQKTALVCGAGPSLKDCLPEIRKSIEKGGIVFAANTAAQFFNQNGIKVDYQVLLHPHIEILEELGEADKYLVASICPPEVFDVVKHPVLWHPLTGWMEEVIPRTDKKFTFIGGGITVTNSILGIAYTWGFRNFECYGMDSSFGKPKGKFTHWITHAVPRSARNIVDCEVESQGKIYKTSFDMKQQVIVFEELYRQLLKAGCIVKMFGSGLLPDLFNAGLLPRG